MAKTLPTFLKKYFWDIDFAKLDPDKRATYIIERLLEMGDEKAVRWVLQTFKKSEIKKVIRQSRNLSPQTANFWSLILDVNKKDITCLQKPYLNIRQSHWPY